MDRLQKVYDDACRAYHDGWDNFSSERKVIEITKMKRAYRAGVVTLSNDVDTDGVTLVPLAPRRALLISMASRFDHSFIVDEVPGSKIKIGYSPEMREILINQMRQVHEEVVGIGFYSKEKEDYYLKIAPQPEKTAD